MTVIQTRSYGVEGGRMENKALEDHTEDINIMKK
jgi:hypothetical protein